ncbi:MAG TPA: nucleotidyltransferase family protein [Methylomirabilota bacterium]|jgi:molybdenum cofactor cytidylyltransferase|nr:nucleotidyltransferase family protein [Methylomirabilota bacterium]
MIAAVVLAAGLSRRMGQAKLLLTVGGRAIIRYVVESVLAGGVDSVWVVTGPDVEPIETALGGIEVQYAVNPAPEEGQAGSVRTGIAALPPSVDSVLIALGDQPLLAPSIIPALLAARRASPKLIVAPRYRDGQGNPVVFKREIFPELLRLTGDQGARPIIQKEPTRVEWVELDLPMPADVDTPDDYEKIRANLRAGNHAV